MMTLSKKLRNLGYFWVFFEKPNEVPHSRFQSQGLTVSKFVIGALSPFS